MQIILNILSRLYIYILYIYICNNNFKKEIMKLRENGDEINGGS